MAKRRSSGKKERPGGKPKQRPHSPAAAGREEKPGQNAERGRARASAPREACDSAATVTRSPSPCKARAFRYSKHEDAATGHREFRLRAGGR